MKCPCHSGKDYNICCEPYHKQEKLPETPLILMRSRYSAYALDLPNYIIETTHPESPLYEKNLGSWTTSIHQFSKTTLFEDLVIESSGDTHVTFFAKLTVAGNDVSFREHSLFEKLNGRLYYLKPL